MEYQKKKKKKWIDWEINQINHLNLKQKIGLK